MLFRSFRTTVGAVSADDDPLALAYLRPETAQGIFINFANVLNTSRRKLPFGIAQIGKAFRNEVTPGNFIFRTREFEQMEMEYFCRPEDAARFHQEFIDGFMGWFAALGISSSTLKVYEQSKDELAHYAERTVDILYRFFPEREDEIKQFDELMGIANRTDFDTKTHSKKPEDDEGKQGMPDNLFLNYLSRIHREEDFAFILKGVTRLLMNPLAQTYLPYSQRKIQFHQELLIFFWKFCEHNKKFLFYVLKSSDVLEILTPILHHLNESRYN